MGWWVPGWLRLSNLRCCGKLCCVPSASKRLDQLNRGRHFADAQSGLGLLVAQQGILRSNYVEVGIETGLVSRHGDLQILLRRVTAALLPDDLLGGHAQGGNVIFHLLKRRQDVLFVRRHIGIVIRGVLGYRRVAKTGVKEGLGG